MQSLFLILSNLAFHRILFFYAENTLTLQILSLTVTTVNSMIYYMEYYRKGV